MHTRSNTAVRILFLLAGVWALVAGVWILLTPFTVESITATEAGADTATAVRTVEQISWYQAQGVWGVFVLALFAILYGGAAWLVWRRRRLAGAGVAVLALLLTFLAMFSIGAYYLPAAALSLIALLWLGLNALLTRSSNPTL